MAEKKLTAAQQAVVAHRGGALLVSAAAGSGKSTVLVERLLGMICDPIAPKNVDEFLVITYTKAAASELRDKIASALSERLAQDPGNRHLQRQLNRLYLAQISTVHAFCATLLRTYPHQLDIPADFRVAEEVECDAIRHQCLEQTLEDAYQAQNQTPEVQRFLDTLGFGRDDRTAGKLVAEMYFAALCHPDPEAWMQSCAQEARAPVDDLLQTLWGKSLLAHVRRQLNQLKANLETVIAACRQEAQLEEKYVPVLQSDLALLDQLLDLTTWQDFHLHHDPAFARMPTVRKCADSTLQEWVKKVRGDVKEQVQQLLQPFSASPEEAMEDRQNTGDAICGLFRLTADFMRRYLAVKRSRHILDFSDLEQEAVRLLVQRGTRLPTASAKEISRRFAEIMVDEYQDTNEVQDLIFSAVSNEGRNCFFVGDGKQSIYRFRMADPSIFLEKYLTYADVAQAEAGQPVKILLSENFRSAPEILDAANSVFYAVMSRETGGLDYGPAEALIPGVQRARQTEPVVELHGIQTGEPETETAPVKGDTEAAFVAGRIAQLLGTPLASENRPVKAGDITILLRSVKSDARYYMAALKARGIGAVCDTGESILDTVELETVTAVLQILDNPHQDVYLIAALASPLFAIPYRTFALARAGRRDGDLYDCLCRFQDASLQDALATIRALREEMGLLSLAELMQRLERTLHMRSIFGAMAHGEQRLHNLDAFFALSASFDPERTLRQFLEQLDALKQQGIAGSLPSQERDAVHIMSIHKSKGLEFPVVFLAGLSKQFNLQDLAEPVLVHPQLGVGCKVVDPVNRVSYPTAARQAIGYRLRQETVSEEMRILYVAMTRAKDRLVMTYCANDLTKKLDRLASELRLGSARQAAQRVSCPGDWILLSALGRAEAGELRQFLSWAPPASVSEIPWRIQYHNGPMESVQAGGTLQGLQDQSLACPNAQQLKRQLAFVYPHLATTTLPTKITATQLKGRTLDLESAEQATPQVAAHFVFEKPRFAAKERGLSPTERGTATHLAMQFVRYAACRTLEGIREELARLERERFLSEQQAQAVQPETLWRFFSSALGQRVLNAPSVVREFKFTVLTDAALLRKDAAGEQVLLQGVTDCCILEEDGVTVLDFKTDRVRPGGEARAAERYRGQMEAYSLALARVFQKPIKARILYFFATGEAITL